MDAVCFTLKITHYDNEEMGLTRIVILIKIKEERKLRLKRRSRKWK